MVDNTRICIVYNPTSRCIVPLNVGIRDKRKHIENLGVAYRSDISIECALNNQYTRMVNYISIWKGDSL